MRIGRCLKGGIFFVFVSLVLSIAFSALAEEKTTKGVLMASTIGPVDAGLVDFLEAKFEEETGVRVRHVAAGTGAALAIARQGGVDLVMVHAKKLEEEFVAAGFGTKRYPIMYNDFVIVGPSNDPAGIKGIKKAREAFKKIAESKANFISRGDKSGTHMAELDIWKIAEITPEGEWYKVYENGAQGNTATLLYTDSVNSYTLIDRATFLGCKDKIKIAIMVEGDEALLNYISVIPINKEKFAKANYEGAICFINWMSSPATGQKLIKDFGVEKYGGSIFFPNSDEWNKK
ncbi:MAG: substrate-binding domain-containing protein [Deltaproteobacteria bacterium]|nr:substrate-binding domain-containing protein [Deltaproteobacteria bacterium]